MKVLIFIVALVTAGYARPSGAPASACDTLTPMHGSNQPQTSMSPFTVDLSPFAITVNESEDMNVSYSTSYWYVPGQTYRLQLAREPGNSSTFRGFFVQSRTVADDSTRVGTFGVVNSSLAKLGPCTPMDSSSITHTNNVDKTGMMMDWTAPPVGTGAIRFRYAVVQVYSTFWADLSSEEVQEAPSGNCTDVECNTGQTCILSYGRATCVCSDNYYYNPNTGTCKAGQLSLPIRLNPTVVSYNGECSELNTSEERYSIYQVIRTTIQKSRIYRYFN